MNTPAVLAAEEPEPSEAHFTSRVTAFEIGADMHGAGLPARFIVRAVDLSGKFRGIFKLMQLWRNEQDPQERDAVLADIQELIDDCSKHEHAAAAYVRFDDLDQIASDIRAFKDSLRVLVDERGGVSKLAQLMQVPQSSMSRFFNSTAMPHRITLIKIAQALNLSQVQICTRHSV